MNATLVLELFLIQPPMIVKNDFERSRSRTTLAEETGSKDKNKYACQNKKKLVILF